MKSSARSARAAWGEVYLARDTVLNRHVALKVLPEAFVRDGERLARFEREAQLLASLNHANIAHGHGFEGTSGLRALVMELVEGDNLSDRIAQGPIRLADVLSIARQIADALEAAHEQGIVHRDRTDDIFSIQNVTRRCGASTSTSAESRRASTRRSGSRARRALRQLWRSQDAVVRLHRSVL